MIRVILSLRRTDLDTQEKVTVSYPITFYEADIKVEALVSYEWLSRCRLEVLPQFHGLKVNEEYGIIFIPGVENHEGESGKNILSVETEAEDDEPEERWEKIRNLQLTPLPEVRFADEDMGEEEIKMVNEKWFSQEMEGSGVHSVVHSPLLILGSMVACADACRSARRGRDGQVEELRHATQHQLGADRHQHQPHEARHDRLAARADALLQHPGQRQHQF